MDAVRRIQLGLMIFGHYPELQSMAAGLDSCQDSLLWMAEHPHQLPIHVGMQMVSPLSFNPAIAYGDLVPLNYLSFLGSNDFEACSLPRA